MTNKPKQTVIKCDNGGTITLIDDGTGPGDYVGSGFMDKPKQTRIEEETLAFIKKHYGSDFDDGFLTCWDTREKMDDYSAGIRRGLDLALESVVQWEGETHDASDPSNESASDRIKKLLSE